MSTIYYYEPFFSFNDVNRLFDRALGAVAGDDTRRVSDRENSGALDTLRSFRPKLDLHENAETKQITATFELPGLNKEGVSIDIHNNRLTVSGETKFSKDSEENGYVVKERRRGKFSRTLPLPAGTKPEEIKATMENGVLTVSFPKSTPEEAAKRITIS